MTEGQVKQGLWGSALAWAEARLETCKEVRGWDEAAPCRRFVAEALDQVFGLNDFKRNDAYLSISAVAKVVVKPDSGWLQIGRADNQDALDLAQASANDGLAVLAVYRGAGVGHVALILPGESTVSRSWKKRMPNAASIIGTGAERSFIGAPLSYAFSSGKAEKVMLYQRERAESDLFGSSQPAITAAAIEDDLLGPVPEDLGQVAPAAGDAAAVPQTPLIDALPPTGTVDTATAADQRAVGQVAALGPAVPLPAEIKQELAYPAGRGNNLSGTWCGPEVALSTGQVRAVLIDEERRRLSWGTLQPDQPGSFKENHSLEILGVNRDGEVLGVTVADTSAVSADATVFFIFSTADTLLETHRFDHVSHDIVVKGDAWQRCS